LFSRPHHLRSLRVAILFMEHSLNWRNATDVPRDDSIFDLDLYSDLNLRPGFDLKSNSETLHISRFTRT